MAFRGGPKVKAYILEVLKKQAYRAARELCLLCGKKRCDHARLASPLPPGPAGRSAMRKAARKKAPPAPEPIPELGSDRRIELQPPEAP